jgi:hypothetical protein
MAAQWLERALDVGRIESRLGFGGMLVTVFVCSFFAATTSDAIVVIFSFGPHAFFVEGLRVVNWKHGVLSNGEQLPALNEVFRILLFLVLWFAFVGLINWLAGFLGAFLKKHPPWVTAVLRLIGGSIFLLFCFWIVHQPMNFIHPTFLSSLIAGLVLVSKGVVSLFRNHRANIP